MDEKNEKNEKPEPTIEEKIEKAIGILLDQVRTNLKPAEQLQQTQALLNMAHARTQLLTEGKPIPKKQGTGV